MTAGRQVLSKGGTGRRRPEAFAANRYRKYELTAQSVMQLAPEAAGIYGL
jgi:hypothetical protein